MNYTVFGKTGKQVSSLGMGGMRFENHITDDECVQYILKAHELGVNYFDTAPIYNEDRSESLYGRAFAQMPRENFHIATKGANDLSAEAVDQWITRSIKRLNIEYIDFYFLWCIITPEQYANAKMKGNALEGILKAKERGLINHIGVSVHSYNELIMHIVDDGIFDFIMIPYNALNFNQREEGLRYAKQKNLGTVVMNPIYGGVIAQYKNTLKIYPDSVVSPVEDALHYCMDSPFVDVTLAGMNSFEMINENIGYANQSKKLSVEEQNVRQKKIHSAFTGLCTGCGYCLRHCPQAINIKSYMEIYNNILLTHDMKQLKARYEWYHRFGVLLHDKKRPSDCTACQSCERECTQYLPIIERLEWLDEQFGK